MKLAFVLITAIIIPGGLIILAVAAGRRILSPRRSRPLDTVAMV